MFFPAVPPKAPAAKPVPAAKGAPSAVTWTYDSPPGFQLLEPSYRFPTQVKQALVQCVQPDPALCRAYQEVFADKRRFVAWFRGVLQDRKTALARAAESGPTVLSSDPLKVSVGRATLTSTAPVRPRGAQDQAALERHLAVLKAWAPE